MIAKQKNPKKQQKMPQHIPLLLRTVETNVLVELIVLLSQPIVQFLRVAVASRYTTTPPPPPLFSHLPHTRPPPLISPVLTAPSTH